jgi:hypothetical protein
MKKGITQEETDRLITGKVRSDRKYAEKLTREAVKRVEAGYNLVMLK